MPDRRGGVVVGGRYHRAGESIPIAAVAHATHVHGYEGLATRSPQSGSQAYQHLSSPRRPRGGEVSPDYDLCGTPVARPLVGTGFHGRGRDRYLRGLLAIAEGLFSLANARHLQNKAWLGHEPNFGVIFNCSGLIGECRVNAAQGEIWAQSLMQPDANRLDDHSNTGLP